MLIRIVVDETSAPAGHLSAEAGPVRSFSGWLELLGLLSDLLEDSETAPGEDFPAGGAGEREAH